MKFQDHKDFIMQINITTKCYMEKALLRITQQDRKYKVKIMQEVHFEMLFSIKLIQVFNL